MKQQAVAIMCVFVAAGFLSQPLPAQEQKKGQQIEVKEATYDFGKVVAGAKLQHVFEVGNSGDAALDIQKVQTS